MASIKKFHSAGCPKGVICECAWRLDYRPLGMRGPRKRIEFPTKKAAEKFLAETSHKVSRGEYIDPAKVPTFKEAAERYFASKADRRLSTISDLRGRLDKHILPRLGGMRLNRITLGDVEALRDGLKAEGYAHRTIANILPVVAAVFDAAIRRGECTANPADKLERVFASTPELAADGSDARSGDMAVDPREVLSPDEIRRMLDGADENYRPLLMTAYVTGMRVGELLGLQWGDVEFGEDGRGKIFVRRSLSRARVDRTEAVRPRFYPPKTKSGIRTITIPPALVSALKAWKLRCPVSQIDLVFPHVDGRPNCRDRVRTAGLHPALRRAGLRKVSFHSLRHSCASAMIAAGSPITEIQHRLGHANAGITLKVYSHFFADAETDAADRLADAVLLPAGHRSGQKVGLETERSLKSA